MAYEKRLKSVPAQLFTADGTSRGRIEIADACAFKVKQKIILTSNTQGVATFEVKRVESYTVLYVGPISDHQYNSKISDRSDISNYLVADAASIYAEEQSRPNIPQQEIERLTYEEEPVVGRRTILVDKLGNKIDENNPLPVTDVALDAALDVPLSSRASEATLQNVADSVSSIDLKLNTLGQKDAAGSVPVVLASDHPPIQVDLDAFNTSPDNVMMVGSVDGTKTGTKYGFINNIKQQILAAHDRTQGISYADFGTKDQRITSIDYSSTLFPGTIARKTITYTLVGTRYRRDTIEWSIL